MNMQLAVGVAVALFSVFGFICTLRMIAEWLFPNRRVSVAVEVRDAADAMDLDMLLQEARARACRHPSRLIVLISTDLMDGTMGTGDELCDAYAALLDDFGAECYLIDP